MGVLLYYGIRGRLAEHRDYGHSLIRWIHERRDAAARRERT